MLCPYCGCWCGYEVLFQPGGLFLLWERCFTAKDAWGEVRFLRDRAKVSWRITLPIVKGN